MNKEALSFWSRAVDSLQGAAHVLSVSSDRAASSAYYAAFYAVSAHFALAQRSFSKHSAVQAAVHRDLVNAGLWPKELGEEYSDLVRLRTTDDYGVEVRVSQEDAQMAVADAQRILRAVQQMRPDLFADPESLPKDNHQA